MAVSSDVSDPRRQPRVAYSASVRLSGEWSDREPCFVPLLAHSLDLSEGGMALVTPLPLRLGAAVTCSMRVGGRQLYVVGSVAWERTGADGMRRVGIRFLTPSDEDAGLMRRLLALGQTHPHRVQLRFEGRPDTLSALAQLTRSGLALTAPLPILRRDTAVRFAFDHAGATFQGHVDRVRLAQLEGMPALQVGIRVRDPRAVHDAAKAASRDASHNPALASVRIHDADVRDDAIVDASLNEATTLDDTARGDATPQAVEVDATLRDMPVASVIQAMRARIEPLPLRLTVIGMLALAAFGTGALMRYQIDPAVQASIHIMPAPSSGESTARTTLRPREPVAGVQRAQAALPSGRGLPPSSSSAPSFKWRRDRSEIFVPLEGEAKGLHAFRVGKPLGISIDLPAAHGPLHAERYPVNHHGVRRVDVAPFESGTRVRVWLSEPFDYRLEAKPNGLRIVLAR